MDRSALRAAYGEPRHIKRLFDVPLFLGAALVLSAAAQAQTYPNKPIRLVVSQAPAGAADILARLIAPKTAQGLGQTILVENRSGGGGTIGTASVARAPADGYTLVFVTSGHASNATLYSKLPYDTLKDLTAVSGVAFFPMVVVVNAQTRYKSVKDLVADGHARPGKLNYATAGGSGLTALSAEVFRQHFKLDIVPINYKGSGPALTALMAKEVDFLVDTVPGIVAHVAAGKLRAIAVTTRERSSVLPEVPTIAEEGARGFDILGWFGILAPGGTPGPVVERLNREIQRAQGELSARYKELGVERLAGSADEFGRMIESEVARWGEVIKRLGLKAD
jgi:tripartite-type tricarboxylate transporter receptor subunit TctC